MRELVREMCSDWDMSMRGACGTLQFATFRLHYKYRRTDQAAVARRIKEICETGLRYGYQRMHVLPRREG